MCIGGQLASASASRGVRLLFLAEFPFLSDGQKGFFIKLEILLLMRFVRRTAVVAMNAPPPTRAPQAIPTDVREVLFLFFLEAGGMSVR